MHELRRIGRDLGISSDFISKNRSLGGGNSWKLGGGGTTIRDGTGEYIRTCTLMWDSFLFRLSARTVYQDLSFQVKHVAL